MKKVRIIIRCRPETRARFRAFCKLRGMDYEEAINYLLDREGFKILTSCTIEKY